MEGKKDDRHGSRTEPRGYRSVITAPFKYFDEWTHDGTTCRALKNISGHEWGMVTVGQKGKVFSWSLVLECMTQTAGMFDEILQKKNPPQRAVVSRICRTEFFENPRPGDQMIISARLIKCLGNQAVYHASALIGNQPTASADIYIIRIE